MRWVDDLSEFDPASASVVVEAVGERVAFQVLHDQGWFTARYSLWLDEQNLLRREKTLFRTCQAMAEDGFDILILPSAEDVLVSVLLRWPVDQPTKLL